MRTILLPGSFDITAVSDVAVDLVEALAHGDLTLDGNRVTRIDGAGLQLLCAAVAAARAAGVRMAWAGASAVLRRGARMLALSAVLDLPDAQMLENE